MVSEFLRGCFLVWVGGLPKSVIYLESEWKGLCDRVRGLCLLALSLFLRVLWLCFGSLESYFFAILNVFGILDVLLRGCLHGFI